MDEALRAVIEAHGFEANPGIELREGDTAQARLGQLLFFDPILSGDQNISCATCHHPAFAMADGRTLPIGTGGLRAGAGASFSGDGGAGRRGRRVRRLAGETDAQTDVTTVSNPFAGQFVPRNSPTIINSALLCRASSGMDASSVRVGRAVRRWTLANRTVKTLERTRQRPEHGRSAGRAGALSRGQPARDGRRHLGRTGGPDHPHRSCWIGCGPTLTTSTSFARPSATVASRRQKPSR